MGGWVGGWLGGWLGGMAELGLKIGISSKLKFEGINNLYELSRSVSVSRLVRSLMCPYQVKKILADRSQTFRKYVAVINQLYFPYFFLLFNPESSLNFL